MGGVMRKKIRRVVKFQEGIEVWHLDCMVKRLIHPRTTGSKNVANAVAIVETGKEIKSHHHSFEEAYFVVEGEALMRVDGDEFTVGAWDAVYIPPEVEHWTLNTGKKRLVLVTSLSPPPPFD